MERLKKILSSKVFAYVFIAVIFGVIVFLRVSNQLFKDVAVDTAVKNIATELAVLALILVAFVKKELFGFARLGVTLTGFLWALPCFLVAFANFPFSALISGKAVIVNKDLIYLIAIECFVVAVTEELFFRAVVGNYLDKNIGGRHKTFKCVMASAGIFGAWHIINLFGGAGLIPTLIQVGYTFLIGAMLSMLLIKTKSLTLCVLVHAIFNFGGAIVERAGQGPIHDSVFWALTIGAGVFCFVFMGVSYLQTEKPFADTNK